MGLFNWLSNSKDTADKALGMLSSGVDKAIYTKEEVVDTALRTIELYRDESSTRSISRRIIAWAFVSVSLLSFIGASIALALGHDISEFLTLIDTMNISWATVTIIVFYFGPTTINAIRGVR